MFHIKTQSALVTIYRIHRRFHTVTMPHQLTGKWVPRPDYGFELAMPVALLHQSVRFTKDNTIAISLIDLTQAPHVGLPERKTCTPCGRLSTLRSALPLRASAWVLASCSCSIARHWVHKSQQSTDTDKHDHLDKSKMGKQPDAIYLFLFLLDFLHNVICTLGRF